LFDDQAKLRRLSLPGLAHGSTSAFEKETVGGVNFNLSGGVCFI
jgi:hypothetical protein